MALLAGGCRKRGLLPASDGAAVIIVGGDAGGAVVATAETEPNDRPAQATVLFAGDSVTVIEGEVGAEGNAIDVDRYRLRLAGADAGVAGEVASTDPDAGDPAAAPDRSAARRLSLSLVPLAAEGAVRVELSPHPDATPWLRATVPASGLTLPNLAPLPWEAPLVTVSPVRRQGQDKAAKVLARYRLTVFTADFGPGEEREPNGDFAQAMPLAGRGGTVELAGTLAFAGDRDVLAVPREALGGATAVSVEVRLAAGTAATLALTGEDGAPWFGYPRPASGRLLLTDVRLPPVTEAARPALFVTLVAAGVPQGGGPYVLSLQPGQPAASELTPARESEPNDTPARASALAAGEPGGFVWSGQGTFHPMADVDLWRLPGTVPAGALLTVSVRMSARIEREIALLGPGGGEPLARLDAAADTPQPLGPAPPGGGFVLVREKSGKRLNPEENYVIEVVW
jgi:hypothetical protein